MNNMQAITETKYNVNTKMVVETVQEVMLPYIEERLTDANARLEEAVDKREAAYVNFSNAVTNWQDNPDVNAGKKMEEANDEFFRILDEIAELTSVQCRLLGSPVNEMNMVVVIGDGLESGHISVS